MCRSVPHSPTAFTRISTSFGPTDGTGTCCSVKPGAAAVLRSARIVPGIAAARAGRSLAVEIIGAILLLEIGTVPGCGLEGALQPDGAPRKAGALAFEMVEKR